MNTEKFTQKTNEVIELAQKVAIKLNHAKLDGEHLHYALLEVEGSLISNVLSAIGIDVTALTEAVYDQLEKLPRCMEMMYNFQVQEDSINCLYMQKRKRSDSKMIMSAWSISIWHY